MKPAKTNLYTGIGIFLVGITLLLKNLLALPEFFSGLGLGMGLALELVGFIKCSHGQNYIKNAKLSLIRRLTGEPHQ